MAALNLIYEKAMTIPFKISPTGNVGTTVDLAKLWADRVLVAVGTLKKERLLLPHYGSEVPLHSMDPMRTVEDLIQADVAAVFASQLSVLNLIEVTSAVNSNDGSITIEVTYALPTSETVTTQIGFASINSAGNLTEKPR